MAETLSILGQADLNATTLTDVYTVPAVTSVVISSVIISNRGGTATTFRLSVADDGEADDNKQYLYYDTPLPANDSFAALVGITLSADDVVRVYAGNGNVSVNIFGVQVT